MDFIVLASDGLWDKVENQEVIDTALRVCLGPDKVELTNDCWKEDDEFACENTSPPSKSRRISLVKQQKVKSHSPLQQIKHNRKRPFSNRLVTACKELVNLAVTRGSLDDITVMIIDLHQLGYNS
ncbi:hypothetical protein AQUCO_01100483v1 [Aquilegia coerulea]|uniref:PPM-type phosphatase domain-containing protein n=1 Tax=Aquilegia coerulea TaxID=218851 RepID=A0A2G5E7B9_AQUCA|nr:hypothetical protein AQUCO_01100483v1 [Aquilegia coerulea]